MQDAERRQNYLIGLGVSALLLVIVRRSFLWESLWLDESISFWVVQGSLRDVVYRAINFQGQSPLYYLLLWCTKKWLGDSELALRAPSLLAMALCMCLLYSLGSAWFNKQVALLSLAFFISLDSVLRAMSARPYALALLLALLSVWSLWRWLERSGFCYWLLYTAGTILAFYAHYLFIGILVVHLACVLSRKPVVSGRRLMWFSFAWGWVALAVMAAWPQLGLLWERKAQLFFSADAFFKDLVFAWFPLSTLVYLAAGLLMALVFSYRSVRGVCSWQLASNMQQMGLVVLLIWCFFPPLVFYLFSHTGFGPPFVDRYYLWCSPALALLCAFLIKGLECGRAGWLVAGVVLALMLVREIDRHWEVEDWKTAAVIAEQEWAKNQGPVLLYSGLIEAEEVKWLKAPLYQSYLAAPLAYYKVSFKPLLLSAKLSGEGQEQYFRKKILSRLEAEDSFLLVFLRRNISASRERTMFVNDIYGPLFSSLGFAGEELLGTGPVRVWRYKRVDA